MAMMLGRSRMINAADCTVSTPLDCDFPMDPLNTVPAPSAQSGRPSTYTAQLVKYTSGYKIHQMLSAGVLSQHCKDYDLVMKFHTEILEILDFLPPTYSTCNPDTSWDATFPDVPKQRLHISVVISSILMALHRPHAMRFPFSRVSAIRAALDILAAQQRLFNLLQEYQYRIHSLTFFTLDAAMFLTSMSLRRKAFDPPDDHGDVDGLPLREICIALSQAQVRLEKAKTRSAVAGAAARIIRYCLLRIQMSTQEVSVASPHRSTDTLRSPSTGTNMLGPSDESASGHLEFSTDKQNVTTSGSDYHTISPDFKASPHASVGGPQDSRFDADFGKALVADEGLGFDFGTMINIGHPSNLTSPFDGLRFDVDLQTGVWMEQIGIAEDTFTEPELEHIT